MSAWLKAQTSKRETAAAKNDLESYIISTREALETDERLIKVCVLGRTKTYIVVRPVDEVVLGASSFPLFTF